jgi:uncharacterized membrane protein
MECPRCHFQADADFCPQCSLDLAIRRELEVLKGELERLKLSRIQAPVPPVALSDQGDKAGAPGNVPLVTPAPSAGRARSSGGTELAVGQKWFLGLGVLILLLGVGFFLKYAFDAQQIGPTMQVTAGFVGGTLCLVLGEVCRRAKLRGLDIGVAALGLGLILLSAYAASQIYDLLPAWLSFLLALVGTALGIVLSLGWNSAALASLSLTGGFLATVLFTSSPLEQGLFFAYLILLNVAGQLLTFLRRWPWIDLVRFVLSWVAYFTWLSYHRHQQEWLTSFTFLQLLFLSLSLLPFLQRDLGLRRVSFVIGLINGLFCLENSRELFHFEKAPTTLVALAYATLCLAVALVIWRQARPGLGVTWLIGEGMVFLLIMWAVLLSAQWVIIFWAAQTVVLYWLSVRMQDRFLRAGVAILGAVVGFYFFFSCFDLSDWPVNVRHHVFSTSLPARWVTSFFVIASFFSIVLVDRPREQQQSRIAGWFELLSVLTLFGFLNSEITRFGVEFSYRASQTAYSVLWTFFGAGLLAYGLRSKRRLYRFGGIALLLLTVVKVLAVDTAQATTPYRILSCLALGAVLVALSFLYHRFSEQLHDLEPPAASSDDQR